MATGLRVVSIENGIVKIKHSTGDPFPIYEGDELDLLSPQLVPGVDMYLVTPPLDVIQGRQTPTRIPCDQSLTVQVRLCMTSRTITPSALHTRYRVSAKSQG